MVSAKKRLRVKISRSRNTMHKITYGQNRVGFAAGVQACLIDGSFTSKISPQLRNRPQSCTETFNVDTVGREVKTISFSAVGYGKRGVFAGFQASGGSPVASGCLKKTSMTWRAKCVIPSSIIWRALPSSRQLASYKSESS